MLSTPPAFILSQDQTLMLKVLIQPEYLAFLNQKQVPTGILIQVLLFLRFALLKAVRSSFDDLNYSLMNLSRLFTVQLSMFFVLLSCDSLIILSNCCSFVKHFFIFLNPVSSSLSCDSLFILSKCFSFVKNFFVFFCTSVLRQKKAQGVGFEPTRPCGQTVFKTASL